MPIPPRRSRRLLVVVGSSAFGSAATNLGRKDTNAEQDVFVRGPLG